MHKPAEGHVVAHEDDLAWVEDAFTPTADPAWVIEETGYSPTREAGIEARFAIGNGLLGVRGSRSVSRGPTWTSYQHNLSWASWPRNYVAGLFDTPNTEPPVPALVPAPDWLRVRIWIDGELALIRSGTLLAHHRRLDMRRGLLLTEWRQRQPSGRVLRIRTLRLVSQADRALGAQILRLEFDGLPAAVQLEASFQAFGSALELRVSTPELATWRTALSAKTVAVAVSAGLRLDGAELPAQRPDALDRRWSWMSEPGRTATLQRIVAFARGEAQDESAAARAQAALDRARQAGLQRVLSEHEQAWSERWAAADIEIEGDDEAQRALRFAVYHLVSAANPEDERVSVGARALTGDLHPGHVFWDTEIYLLPFYTLTWPEAARALLLYRYHTLPGARAKAARMGFRGAFYAWESADTGEETTPEKVIDPVGREIEVLCGKQEWHIVADVAYAVWHYWRATQDDDFILAAGAEILLETARFWASCAVREKDGRFHIRGIIGPDEYHECIDDNAFTNHMARWTLRRADELIGEVGRRWPERWRDSLGGSRSMTKNSPTGGTSPTSRRAGSTRKAGYSSSSRDTSTSKTSTSRSTRAGRCRWTWCLGANGRSDRGIKQADVVALLALLPDGFDRRVTENNFRYYEQRCGHGSSLSHGMHGVVAARLGQTEAGARSFP